MTQGFAARLLRWYELHRRDLPWRRTRDPWAIWVSEVMLQQTRVEAVREAFVRFLADYPTPAAWAAADDDALLRAWRGLGYYRRARLLRDGARTVVARHCGTVPADPGALGALPGIGDYTRGAIASLAFGRSLPAIDGNVERVAARHAGIEVAVKSGAGRRQVAEWVGTLLPRVADPGAFNQALMELGALVCTPRTPRCTVCPVRADCTARQQGLATVLPRLPARRPAVDVLARAAWLPAGEGRIWAHRLASDTINAGQWELPGPGLLASTPTASALADWLRAATGGECAVGGTLARVRHGITHHRILLHVHAARGPRRWPAAYAALDPHDPDVTWTTAMRKAFGSVLRAGRLSSPRTSIPD